MAAPKCLERMGETLSDEEEKEFFLSCFKIVSRKSGLTAEEAAINLARRFLGMDKDQANRVVATLSMIDPPGTLMHNHPDETPSERFYKVLEDCGFSRPDPNDWPLSSHKNGGNSD